MNLASNPLRLAAALAAAVSLSACTGSTDFTVTKDFSVNATGGLPYTYAQPVDLAADAPDAWKHRSKIKSLDLVGADATIQSVFSGSGTTGGGSILLRPDGGTAADDVVVGSWPGTEPVVAPHSLQLTLDAASVGVLEGALRGNGKFTLLLSGSTAADASFLSTVQLHLKLTYKVI